MCKMSERKNIATDAPCEANGEKKCSRKNGSVIVNKRKQQKKCRHGYIVEFKCFFFVLFFRFSRISLRSLKFSTCIECACAFSTHILKPKWIIIWRRRQWSQKMVSTTIANVHWLAVYDGSFLFALHRKKTRKIKKNNWKVWFGWGKKLFV